MKFLVICTACIVFLSGLLCAQEPPSYYAWWEGEDATATNMTTDMGFKPENAQQAKVLSGGKWLGSPGQLPNEQYFAEYEITVPQDGTYGFYARKFWKHGPYRWRFDDQAWQQVTREVALLDQAPLRVHVTATWTRAGEVKLSAGKHKLRIELLPDQGRAACFDAFCLTLRPFQARGLMKPDARYGTAPPGWFAFEPDWDPYDESPIDLRSLNEQQAGAGGFIQVRGDQFVHGDTGKPVRFWAVNTGHELARMDRTSIDACARFLAKRGVNMVRIHGGMYRGSGPRAFEIDPEELDRIFYLMAALKKNGIYTGMSIHFQHWLDLSQVPDFPGYDQVPDGRPFAIHFFDPAYQDVFRSWWKATLDTVNPYTGMTLAEDPAVGYCEIINEDNFFFWTFKPYEIVPAAYMATLEKMFGAWLSKKYGSIEKAFATWGTVGSEVKGDLVAEGRVGLYFSGMLTSNDWAVNNRNPARAEDCARFLADVQRDFFSEMRAYITRDLGYGGPVCGSNMSTADHRVLTPIERWTNGAADFFDYHGYYGGDKQKAGPPHFSLEVGDSYADRSVLRFDPRAPGKGGVLPSVPFLAPEYAGKPYTCSEFAWMLPNQYQAEMPFLAAVLGRTTGLDAQIFFALDVTPQWSSRTNSYWPIQVPGVAGQWPATALLYRMGHLEEGKTIVDAELGLDKLFALQGSPIVAPKAGDDLNEQMAPSGENTAVVGGRVDPRAFCVGKVKVRFSDAAEHSIKASDISQYVDGNRKLMTSSTGEWTWDYGNGVMQLHAPGAQGVCGFLSTVGTFQLPSMTVSTQMEYGTILAVAMDGKPLDESDRILLQVMSRSQDYGFRASPESGMRTIKDRGTAPIVVENFAGTVSLKRDDAAELAVTFTDFNGYPTGTITGAGTLELAPDVLHYVITR